MPSFQYFIFPSFLNLWPSNIYVYCFFCVAENRWFQLIPYCIGYEHNMQQFKYLIFPSSMDLWPMSHTRNIYTYCLILLLKKVVWDSTVLFDYTTAHLFLNTTEKNIKWIFAKIASTLNRHVEKRQKIDKAAKKYQQKTNSHLNSHDSLTLIGS